ncbi:hypothetical protein [Clostridium algoriphilum]|nr:hypothetical protein [Clostridium algoriphilum]
MKMIIKHILSKNYKDCKNIKIKERELRIINGQEMDKIGKGGQTK